MIQHCLLILILFFYEGVVCDTEQCQPVPPVQTGNAAPVAPSTNVQLIVQNEGSIPVVSSGTSLILPSKISPSAEARQNSPHENICKSRSPHRFLEPSVIRWSMSREDCYFLDLLGQVEMVPTFKPAGSYLIILLN